MRSVYLCVDATAIPALPHGTFCFFFYYLFVSSSITFCFFFYYLGTSWAGDLAGDLENGAYGRDYALGLAEQLAGLDLGLGV